MQGKRTAVLCMDDCAALYSGCETVLLGSDAHACEAALFRALRDLDENGFDTAYFHAQEQRMGLAVMNRIIRAAGHRIVTVREEEK